ncbi:MAG: hypothetical protein IID46_14330 [Planctomycetes bacterium]|nr:hypothetical protein [Planctomycetota bacterium]
MNCGESSAESHAKLIAFHLPTIESPFNGFFKIRIKNVFKDELIDVVFSYCVALKFRKMFAKQVVIEECDNVPKVQNNALDVFHRGPSTVVV